MNTAPPGNPEQDRAAMIQELRKGGAIVSEEVAAAFSAVPLHDPLPQTLNPACDLGLAAAPGGDFCGAGVVSDVEMRAVMLEQAQIERGMKVLAVGSGGYTAALVAELVGATGQVTTVDADLDLTSRAAAFLRTTGYSKVRVSTADTKHLVPEQSPFDRIVVRTDAWDIPPAWIDSLTPVGRIVVPLRFAGVARVIAFDRTPGNRVLTAQSYRLGSAITMSDCPEEHSIPLTRDAALRLDPQHTPQFHLPALRHALHEPPIECWTGIACDMPDELQLFLLTTARPQLPVLQVSQEIVDHGLFVASARYGVPVFIEGGSFAYPSIRPKPDVGIGYETSVIAHGPEAHKVADRLNALINEWARGRFKRGDARVRYRPKTADSGDLAGWRAIKQYGVLTVDWP
ncbi:methyltransferase, FxLD system [Actinoplanes missouriensis]|uniref:methyltransferase, FxLD system n=1 Tax=Actinoplanes missouriensis TaxID=1866 RepID=UPI0033D3B4A1